MHYAQVRSTPHARFGSKKNNRELMRLLLLPFLSAASAALGLAGLGGCTTVHVHGATVDTVHSTHLRLAIKPERGTATVVVTRGIGVVLGQRSATLGYLDETTVLIPPDAECQTFIFVKDDSQLDSLRTALKDNPALNQLCVLSPGATYEQ
jgi:hypothetical protein